MPPSSSQSAAPPRTGQRAPDFTLPSTSGEDVTHSALGTPTLVAFFPLAFTSTCTDEPCSFGEDYGRFAEAGVRVLPISVDSVPTLQAFRERHGTRLGLSSDFHRDATRAYRVFIPERNYANRAYFLVRVDGVVSWAHVEAHRGCAARTPRSWRRWSGWCSRGGLEVQSRLAAGVRGRRSSAPVVRRPRRRPDAAGSRRVLAPASRCRTLHRSIHDEE